MAVRKYCTIGSTCTGVVKSLQSVQIVRVGEIDAGRVKLQRQQVGDPQAAGVALGHDGVRQRGDTSHRARLTSSA